jgi:hypothetical protein
MTAGDVLYLPHGWWHSVSAVDEPSLHLTIGVEPDNGIDFMTWLVDQARRHELFRRRVPRFESLYAQQEYLDAIRVTWKELLSSRNILDEFLTYADGTSRNRPLFGLPDLLDANNVLHRKSARIVLLVPRATVAPDDHGFVLTAIGRRWAFPSIVKPLIDAFLSCETITVGQAIEVNGNLSEEQISSVIFTLLKAGVIALK